MNEPKPQSSALTPAPTRTLQAAHRLAAESFHCPYEPGQLLAGKYEVVELIGTGGVGFVVAARHHGFDAEVALKFLYPELAAIPECQHYFLREAQTAFRIQSPHVVRLFDVGQLAEGTPFIAMERLRGTDLRRLLERTGPLSEREVITYAQQIAAGL
ncbi:MAG: protein kinase, partial [Polyangiales bacterium]